MLAVDCETTGVDFNHGARPFFITTCDEAGDQLWWQWDVDPLTREVDIPQEDAKAIRQLLATQGDGIVGQNLKFDARALLAGGILDWTHLWRQTHDTLIAGHLLTSNRPHNLTDMVMQYLGVDIEPLEKKLEQAVTEARRKVQQARGRMKRRVKSLTLPGMLDREVEDEESLASWRIAEAGLPEMPSAKGKCWKYDTWLPRAVARKEHFSEDHPWWHVLSEYTNADSSATLALWKAMLEELERRKLWDIYLERLKVLPAVFAMERQGVTVSRARLEELTREFAKDGDRAARVCINLAADRGCELVLPKSGSNGSLSKFVFEELRLPPLTFSNKTAAPSLDKNTLEHWLVTLPAASKQLAFVRNLQAKRKRDTSLSYMESYERFMLPLHAGSEQCVLFPSLNPTGTDTLRMSSNNPNAQNISKQDEFTLRRLFGPASGREWWSLDYQNIELRIPAYESGEPDLIALFERPDEPPFFGSQHLLNFSVVYPEVWADAAREVGEDLAGKHCKKVHAATWYQWCKNGDFAIQYQAGPVTADRAFHRHGSHARLKSRFAKLDALNLKMLTMAERLGYVETMPDLTVDPARGYPLLCTRTEYGQVLPTVPLSYHVQSTAMWCTMKAMTRCHARLEHWRGRRMIDVSMVLQVHDELVFDFPSRIGHSNLTKARELARLMEESGSDIGVPLGVGITYHPDNWAEGEVV